MKTFHTFDKSVFWAVKLLTNPTGRRAEQRSLGSLQAQNMLTNLAITVFANDNLVISRDSVGRPWIDVNGRLYCASISHSRDLVAVALSLDPAIMIGIDVEFCNPERDIDALSRWLELDDAVDGKFYWQWCRYEAIFKATGVNNPQIQPPLEARWLTDWCGYAGAVIVQ